ncbi:MAG: hypothetical protein AAF251_13340 [Pseudomonadota bacterium]
MQTAFQAGTRFISLCGLTIMIGIFAYYPVEHTPDAFSSNPPYRYSLDAPLSDPTMQQALQELRAVVATRETSNDANQARFTFASPTGPVTLREDHVRELNRIYRSLKTSAGREPIDSSYEQRPSLAGEDWEEEQWVEELWNEDTIDE